MATTNYSTYTLAQLNTKLANLKNAWMESDDAAETRSIDVEIKAIEAAKRNLTAPILEEETTQEPEQVEETVTEEVKVVEEKAMLSTQQIEDRLHTFEQRLTPDMMRFAEVKQMAANCGLTVKSRSRQGYIDALVEAERQALLAKNTQEKPTTREPEQVEETEYEDTLVQVCDICHAVQECVCDPEDAPFEAETALETVLIQDRQEEIQHMEEPKTSIIYQIQQTVVASIEHGTIPDGVYVDLRYRGELHNATALVLCRHDINILYEDSNFMEGVPVMAYGIRKLVVQDHELSEHGSILLNIMRDATQQGIKIAEVGPILQKHLGVTDDELGKIMEIVKADIREWIGKE